MFDKFSGGTGQPDKKVFWEWAVHQDMESFLIGSSTRLPGRGECARAVGVIPQRARERSHAARPAHFQFKIQLWRKKTLQEVFCNLNLPGVWRAATVGNARNGAASLSYRSSNEECLFQKFVVTWTFGLFLTRVPESPLTSFSRPQTREEIDQRWTTLPPVMGSLFREENVPYEDMRAKFVAAAASARSLALVWSPLLLAT